jgi:hypothetical protein
MNAGSQPRRAAADDQNVYMDDFALHRALAPSLSRKVGFEKAPGRTAAQGRIGLDEGSQLWRQLNIRIY